MFSIISRSRFIILLLLALMLQELSVAQIDTSKTKLGFDLGITRNGNVNLWPFYKRVKNADKKELQILFPFFQNKRDYVHHTKSYRFLPFYASDSSSAGVDKRILTTYYPSLFHFHKPAPSDTSVKAIRYFRFLEIAPHISLLEINRSANGMNVNNNFFFFVWFKKNEEKKKSIFVVFPTYWRFTNVKDTTQLFFPFYFAKKGNGDKRLNVALLYNQSKTKDHNKHSLFPLWWHKEKFTATDTVKTNLLLPLVWTKKSKKEKKKIIFPFVYSFKDEHKQSLTVFPFFSYGKNIDSSSSYVAITPLFWRIKKKNEVKTVFFPFVWHKKQYSADDTIRRLAVLPVFWSKKSRRENRKIILPVVFINKDSAKKSVTIFPFYSRGAHADSSKSYYAITPFFWHSKNKQRERNVLFPVVWNKKRFLRDDTIRTTRVLPFYWAKTSRRERNRVILPFVFSHRNQFGKKLTVFPFYASGRSADSTRSYFAITPFYWHSRNKNAVKDIFFPLVWNKKSFSKDDTIKRTAILPFYWSFKSKEKNHKVVFPIVYSFRDKQKSSFTLVPIFTVGRTADSSRKYFAVTPFFWHSKNKAEEKNIFFPIVWNKKTFLKDDTIRRTTVLPIYWSLKSREKSHKVIFPLVYGFHDQQKHSFTFFPLFTFGRKDSTRNYFAITPLFWHKKAPGEKKNVFFPLCWNKTIYLKDDTIHKTKIFPVFWSSRSRDKSRAVLFPLVYSKRDHNKWSLTVFPFFSIRNDPDSSRKYVAITPFYWQSKSKTEKRRVIFPFYWSKTEFLPNDTIRSRALLPFYFSIKSNHGKSKIYSPLVYSYRDKSTRSFTLFPLFSYTHNKDNNATFLVVTPFVWHIKTPNEKRNIVFPFYWNKTKYSPTDTIRKTAVLPVFWSYKSKKKNKLVILPVVFKTKDQQKERTTLFPFCSFGHRIDSTKGYFAVTPLFWHTKSKTQERNFLLPFYWNKKTFMKDDTICRTSVLPVYWSYHSKNADKKIVFPFYWNKKLFLKDDTICRTSVLPVFWSYHSKDADKKIVFPLVYRFKDKKKESITVFPFFTRYQAADSSWSYYAVTPLFWHSENKQGKKNMFVPFYWNRIDYYKNDTVRKTTILPVYWSTKSRTVNKKTFFPLVFSYRDKDNQSFTFFPLFSYGHRTDSSNRKYLAVTPFFWHTENSIGKKNVLFPFLWNKTEYYKNDTVRVTAVLPFYWTRKSKNENKKIIFPFVYAYRDAKKESITVFPFFSKGHRKDSTKSYVMITPLFWHHKNGNTTSNILFPFYSDKTEIRKDDTLRVKTILPFYWSRTTKDENKKVFFPFVYSFRSKEKHSLTVLPFFSFGRAKDSSKSYLAITPLFWHTENKSGKKNIFFPLYWNKTEYRANDTVCVNTILPVYWSKRSRDVNKKIFFPLVYQLRDAKKSSFTVFPFFSKGQRADSSASYVAISPLFWHTEKKDEKRNMFLPLYWNKTEYRKDDTIHRNSILPLFFSYKSKDVNRKTFLPVIFSVHDKEKDRFTFFPLFSYGRSKDSTRNHLVVTPLFWHTKNPSKERNVLFPVVWNKKTFLANDTISKTTVLPVLTVKKNKKEKKVNVLALLFRSTKRKDYSKVSVLWPICEREKAKGHKSFRFAPFIWTGRTDTTRLFAIEPFFYSYKEKQKKTFILSAWLFKRDKLDESVSSSVLWRAWYSKKYKNGDFETRFLHLVYANVKKDGKREFSILPFYHKEKDTLGNRSVHVCFGFYSRSKEYRKDIKAFYEEERFFWFIRFRSNYKQLKAQGKVFKRK
jgi:hypothetical protein